MTGDARETAAPDREPEQLVLLSGMLGDERLWVDVVPALGADVQTLCLRTDSSDSVHGVAATILAAAPDHFSVAGHSFGGIIALELWRQAPRRVTRLATISSSATPGTSAQRAAWAELGREVELGGFAQAASGFALSTLSPARRTAALADTVTAMATAVGRQGLINQLTAQVGRPDSRPTLPSISVPTLVVIGADDQLCPPSMQHELAGAVPGAMTTTVPGTGHMVPLEAPAAVAEALRTWLRLPGGAGPVRPPVSTDEGSVVTSVAGSVVSPAHG